MRAPFLRIEECDGIGNFALLVDIELLVESNVCFDIYFSC
jgi:hypothetical protein